MESVAQGNSAEMFLRPRGAMQDREDQGVSVRKVSGTETIFLIFQTPNSKRHGLICTSLRRTSKKEETATMWLRGEKVAEVPWQPWDLPSEDLFPTTLPETFWESCKAYTQAASTIILSVPTFYWQAMASIYCGQEETLHLKCDWEHTEINSGKDMGSYSALYPWSSSIKWPGSSSYSSLSGTTHHHLPFLMAEKDVSTWKMTLPKPPFNGKEKHTNLFWFGGLVKEAASSKYFNFEAYLKVLETCDL